MATFETRVENYVGSQSDDFSDNLTDAAKEVLDLVPKARLRFYSTDVTVTFYVSNIR